MNEKPVAICLHGRKKPFYARMKQVKMSYEDYKKASLDKKNLLIRDARGRIFKLCAVGGGYVNDPKTDKKFKLKNPKFNEEYPTVAIVKEREDYDKEKESSDKEREACDYEILDIINEPAELPDDTETEGGQRAA